MSLPLFRREVFEAKREAWLGRVQVVQPLPVRLVVSISAALIVAAILYVTIGTYTRRVHATGILMPERGLIVVASPAPGIISSTAVTEGQKVQKGQLLYVINFDATSSSGPTQQHVLEGLRKQKEITEKQRDLRRAMSQVEKDSLSERLQNLEQQHVQIRAQIDIERQTIALMKARTDQLQGGVQKGIVRDSDFQSQNYIRMQAVGQQAQYEQLALRLAGQIAETSAALAMFDNKLAHEISEMERRILQLDQMIVENEAKRQVEIRAPSEGTLTAIRAHVGQQVGGGAALVTLLPNEGKLAANLFVDSSAIGFIERNQTVLLRYAAFPFQRFGLYRGMVREVTRAPVAGAGGNTQTAKNSQQRDAADEGAVYRIIVDPEQPFVWANGVQQGLEAGMRVDADIALEKRPLYRWMLDPLYHVRHSMDIVTGAEVK